MVRNNLCTCLRGEAFVWFSSKLSVAERRLLGYGNDLDEWTEALIYQFRESPADGMEVEVGAGERYGNQNNFHQHGPRKYAKTTVGAAKSAEPYVY